VSHAVSVKCCNGMLEFCVLWVLVDSRGAIFFSFFLLTCMVSLDQCGLGCPLGSMHCDMHSL